MKTGENRPTDADSVPKPPRRRRRLEPLLEFVPGLRWVDRVARQDRSEIDAEQNTHSHFPSDEQARVHCVFVVEFYGPGQQQKLLEGIRRLDWDRSEGTFGLPDRRISDWISRSRLSAWGGGWLNLQVILRPGDKRFPFGGVRHRAPLPDGVSHALGMFESLTSGLSAIALQFVLTEAASRRVEPILRATYRTFTTKHQRSVALHGPREQKRKAARAELMAIRGDCSSWFRTNLPGAFAEGLLGGAHPTCLFITLDRVRPYDRELYKALGFDNYVSILGLEDTIDLWASPDFPGAFLDLGRDEANTAGNFVLAGKADEIFTTEQAKHASDAVEGVLGSLSMGFTQSFTFLALSSLLAGYESRVSKLRDELTAISSRRSKAIDVLSSVQKRVIGTAGEVQPIATELAASLRDRWRPDGWEFVPAPDNRVVPKETQLLAAYAKSYVARADRLAESERRTRELFTAVSSVTAAQASLQLSGRAIKISTAVLVVAILGQLGVLDYVRRLFWP